MTETVDHSCDSHDQQQEGPTAPQGQASCAGGRGVHPCLATAASARPHDGLARQVDCVTQGRVLVVVVQLGLLVGVVLVGVVVQLGLFVGIRVIVVQLPGVPVVARTNKPGVWLR